MMIFMHDWEVAALILHLRIEITFYVTFLKCHQYSLYICLENENYGTCLMHLMNGQL